MSSSFPVSIDVDTTRSLGPLRPIYRFFGADEPNYAYMKDGRKLLGELGQLGEPTVFFRAHNLLTTGDGTPALKWGSTNAYTEDENGNPVYDWTIADRIFDAYRDADIKPYVQIGFMPEALSIKPQPYQHRWTPEAKYEDIYTGWAYPPSDYEKWGNLAYEWTKHCIDRYGLEEVEQWYWQVWNEPNIGYWQGSRKEFHKLHDYAIAGVRRALPNARIGGPDTAGGGGQFLRDFLEHCLSGGDYATGKSCPPLDFVSFHAKGQPQFIDDHVRMGIANHLRDIQGAFEIISSYPELKDIPIVIGESDPEGCAACQGPSLGYRNGTMYSSYTAASFTRKLDLATKHGVNLEGALTWAFEFEEQPFFAGFRALATNGIDLPVLNVFRMFGRMGGERVEVASSGEVPLEQMLEQGVRENADVAALASVANGKTWVMVWHYHDDDLAGDAADVELKLSGLQDGSITVRQFRIDEGHSNSYAVWQRLGSPEQPTAEQYAELKAAGKLAEIQFQPMVVENGELTLQFGLPRQAVFLFEIG